MELSEIESVLNDVADRLTRVEADECLACYLDRLIPRIGCRDRSLTDRWNEAQPQPLPGLGRWLESHGGFCDCEVVFNVFDGYGQRWYRGRELQCDAALARYNDDSDALDAD